MPEAPSHIGKITLLMAAIFLMPAAAWSAPEIQLDLPVQCRIGDDCWVVNLVDRDTTSGVRDFLCKKHTYDGHKGTDIAIRDYGVMWDGVAVIAAAPGKVTALRDGMLDGDISLVGRETVKGRECGNAVVIDHGGGWQTTYCHLRRNSVLVRKGDQVTRGQKLGLVGSSGFAQFPHLHFGVRKNGKVIDPFEPLGNEKPLATPSCQAGKKPLLPAALVSAASRGPTVIYDAGFANQQPNAAALRQGFYREQALKADADALVFWVDMYWVEKGDQLTLKVTGPTGKTAFEKTLTLKKTQARAYRVFGKRRATSWPKGTYTGTATLTRETGKRTPFKRSIERQVNLIK